MDAIADQHGVANVIVKANRLSLDARLPDD
jgi:hypothetical protein